MVTIKFINLNKKIYLFYDLLNYKYNYFKFLYRIKYLCHQFEN